MDVYIIARTSNPLQTIETAARTCYSDKSPKEIIEDIKNHPNHEKSMKYVRGVFKSGHLSVFEHVSFTFGIEDVSRAFLAQITRHRLASFSVRSQRYVDMRSAYQNTIEETLKYLSNMKEENVIKYINESFEGYNASLEDGDLKEMARLLLPEATLTTMVVTMNVRELVHLFSLRLCVRAWKPMRDVVEKMYECVMEELPEVFELVGPSCKTLGYCPEGNRSCGKAPTIKQLKEAYDKQEQTKLQ